MILQAQVQSASFWYVALNTGALIAFYYLTSIGLTFYQSWLMKELQFPLTIVLSHFIMKFCLAAGCRAAYTLHTGQTRQQPAFKKLCSIYPGFCVLLELFFFRPPEGLSWVELDDR